MQTPFRIGADGNDANCTQEQAFTDLKFGAQLFLWPMVGFAEHR